MAASRNQDAEEGSAAEADREMQCGCRLAYSSILAVKTNEDAQALLVHVFTQALTKNPPKKIGGFLFYDEKTSAVVQVLEGPAVAVRDLFTNYIMHDPRHTAVRKLWDIDAQSRVFEGFGMKLGSDPSEVLSGAASGGMQAAGEDDLLQLTYMSQLTAPSRDVAYDHIKDILRVAVVTNPKLRIGGALFLNPRTLHVLQALEGPRQAVRSLYEKIAKDPRHNACVIVSEMKVEMRTYEQWGMMQGDLTDWSALANGGWMSFEGMSSLPRRARRNGREQYGSGSKAEEGTKQGVAGEKKVDGGQSALRNGADDEIWRRAHSESAVASIARLEALANMAASRNQDAEEGSAAEADREMQCGCRLAYSSILAVKTNEDAQALLAHVFTQALTKNPPKKIGGFLFYDEKTSAVVQVLEGPAVAVRDLFTNYIMHDPRHTAVRKLWDIDAQSRVFEGFGMKLGSDPSEVLSGAASGGMQAAGEDDLLQLTYMSQLTAPSRDVAYDHIKDILRVAVVTNPKLRIGGALFLNPRTLHVLQALEGPRQAVRSLYEKIAKDPRHNACVIVSEMKVEMRTYEQWGMMQGDLTDWSALANGGWMSFEGMSSLPRRARRNGREQYGSGSKAEEGTKQGVAGEKKAAAEQTSDEKAVDLTPLQTQAVHTGAVLGVLQIGSHGPVVVVESELVA